MPQEKLRLRCKFHLNDDPIKDSATPTAKVSCKVRPTDPPYAEKYADKPLEANVEITLAPSTIELEPANPAVMPARSDPNNPLWRTKVSATVRSASKAVVAGGDILRDKSSEVGGIDPDWFKSHWFMDFTYAPLTQAPLNQWDAQPITAPAAASRSKRLTTRVG